jgi:uncharacterized membrane-anchored protein YitT (DUF2179 family)
MTPPKQSPPRLSIAGRILVEYLILTLGVVIYNLGMDWFLVPNHIAPGGVTGLAIILNARLGWSVGLVFLAANVPLLLAGFRYLGGREFTLRTLYATGLMGATVDPMALIVRPLTYDPLLAALYGGGLVGVGIGIIYHWRGSTAGTDIIALLLKRFTGVKVGAALLATDGLVILAVGLSLNLQVALYALAGIYVKSKVVDSTLKALKARNLSRVRRPTGVIPLRPAALSQNSGELNSAAPAAGAALQQEDSTALQPVRSPSASRLLSGLLLPYTALSGPSGKYLL